MADCDAQVEVSCYHQEAQSGLNIGQPAASNNGAPVRPGGGTTALAYVVGWTS